MQETKCPECSGTQLFRSAPTSTYGGNEQGFSILPGLGSMLSGAKFTTVCCRDCGLIRLYATTEARSRLDNSNAWRRVI